MDYNISNTYPSDITINENQLNHNLFDDNNDNENTMIPQEIINNMNRHTGLYNNSTSIEEISDVSSDSIDISGDDDDMANYSAQDLDRDQINHMIDVKEINSENTTKNSNKRKKQNSNNDNDLEYMYNTKNIKIINNYLNKVQAINDQLKHVLSDKDNIKQMVNTKNNSIKKFNTDLKCILKSIEIFNNNTPDEQRIKFPINNYKNNNYRKETMNNYMGSNICNNISFSENMEHDIKIMSRNMDDIRTNTYDDAHKSNIHFLKKHEIESDYKPKKNIVFKNSKFINSLLFSQFDNNNTNTTNRDYNYTIVDKLHVIEELE